MYYVKWQNEQQRIITDIYIFVKKKIKSTGLVLRKSVCLEIDGGFRHCVYIEDVETNSIQKIVVGFKEDEKYNGKNLYIKDYDRDLEPSVDTFLQSTEKSPLVFFMVDFKEYINSQYWLTDNQKREIGPRYVEILDNWHPKAKIWRQKGHLRIVE
jgi:hypothetical protein